MRSDFACFLALACLDWTLLTDVNGQQNSRLGTEKLDLNCDFESSPCSWTEKTSAWDSSWVIERANEKPYYAYGPRKDHTLGSEDGHFVRWVSFIDYESSAIFTTPPITAYGDTCLSFWYFTTGYQDSTIKVYKVGSERTELWNVYGPQGSRWYKAQINTGTGLFTLEIEAKKTRERSTGNIAIDDIAFSYQVCQKRVLLNEMPQIDCDFEVDLCSWWTDFYGDMQWSRNTVLAPSAPYYNLLPPGGHGNSTAILVIKEFVSANNADLRGPTMSVDRRQACMRFWYKLEGEKPSKLFVQKVDHGEGTHWRRDMSHDAILFSTVQKTEQWLQAFVTLPRGKSFHIEISGGREHSSRSIISVDDIRMTRGGPCPIVSPEQLIYCDFEKDLCGWYMRKKWDEGPWHRNKGSTPTNSTGPPFDHTTGDGYYVFLDASKTVKAQLYSPLFNVGYSGACLSFWSYMYGEDTYRLQVAHQTYSDVDKVIIWSLEGSQENRWVQQNVSLDSKTDAYLTFIAENNYFPRGDVALDDISISFGGKCDNEKQTTAATVIPITRVAEDTTERTTTPVTTEPAPVPTPHLIVVKGDINPALNNSRVELECQHDHANTWIVWYKQHRNENFSRRLRQGTKTILVFDEIQTKDSGIYTCGFTTFSGLSSEQSNEVYIKVVPDLRPSPLLELEVDGAAVSRSEVDVEVDSVLKLTCGRPVKGGVYIWKTTSSAFSNSAPPHSRFLVVNSTRRGYSGTYSCRISKDGFTTGKSNQFNIVIKPGKRCTRDYECYGPAYRRDCHERRCRCARDAVPYQRECRKRPKAPIILTYPKFQEFGVGESFYLICKAEAPVSSSLTYSFVPKRDGVVDSLRIMKITNASEEDSGVYNCMVNYNHITSLPSNGIHVEIKVFVDLNCDFGSDFCGWFLEDANTAEVVGDSASTEHAGESEVERRGPYIQLGGRNSQGPNRTMLMSPTIGRTSIDSCLTFWYLMHGPDVHSLSVWQRSEHSRWSKNEYTVTELWTSIGERGSHWIKQSVTIEKKRNFHIAFEAIGPAAIDDIEFTYRGGC